jgi:Cys-tRNA synthase (O-phospho-L-seryl-tRNA:Cys-tRNA synthase)
MNDPEVAELLLAQPLPSAARRLSEWSPELEGIAVLVDELRQLTAVTLAAAGGKPPTFKPFSRPVTALDRLLVKQRKERHDFLVKQLLPHLADGGEHS